VVLVAMFVLAAAPPALASTDSMAVSIGDRAIVRSGAALVPVTVTCSFFWENTQQTTGMLSVSVSQSSPSGDTSGTSTVPITCDGTTRTYAVAVTSTDGHLRPGLLTVLAHGEAQGSFEREMCVTHPVEPEQCSIWYGTEFLSGSDGPDEIRATGSR
jgi:hypothetical protein